MAGYRKVNFTKEDDEFIRNNYNELSDKEMAKLLRKSESSVASRRRGMGCLKPTPKNPDEYTDEEIKVIMDNPSMTAKELAKLLPGRTVASVGAKRYNMRIKSERAKRIEESKKMAISCGNVHIANKPIQNVFVRIKTSAGCIYVTNAAELADQLQQHKEDKIIKFESYNSIIEMIKDDYMHNDLCMSELIRTNWLNKVDFEDTAILLHWAGEEDALHDFEIDEYLEDGYLD